MLFLNMKSVSVIKRPEIPSSRIELQKYERKVFDVKAFLAHNPHEAETRARIETTARLLY